MFQVVSSGPFESVEIFCLPQHPTSDELQAACALSTARFHRMTFRLSSNRKGKPTICLGWKSVNERHRLAYKNKKQACLPQVIHQHSRNQRDGVIMTHPCQSSASPILINRLHQPSSSTIRLLVIALYPSDVPLFKLPIVFQLSLLLIYPP